MPSRRPPAVLSVLAIALSLGLSGCGGDDSTTQPEPKPTQVSVTGPGSTPSVNFETGKQFVDALATNTSSSLTTAQSLTAPRSAAARYVAEARSGLGNNPSPLAMTDQGDGKYRLCAQGGACTVVAQIVLLDGKISTFRVNGKQLR